MTLEIGAISMNQDLFWFFGGVFEAGSQGSSVRADLPGVLT